MGTLGAFWGWLRLNPSRYLLESLWNRSAQQRRLLPHATARSRLSGAASGAPEAKGGTEVLDEARNQER